MLGLKKVDLSRPGFHGAELKLSRAKELIDLLEPLIKQYLSQNRPYIDTRTDAGNHRLEHYFVVPKITIDFTLFAGDILHNLRSTLDYISSEIVWRATGVWGARTHFPFHKTRDQFIRTAESHELYKLSPKVWKVIEETIRPYHGADGGDHILWALSKLNNLDKHRLLALTAVVGEVSFDATDYERNVFIKDDTIRVFGAGEYLMTVGERMTPHNLSFASDVILLEEKILDRVPLMTFLKQAYNKVFAALNAMEDAFFRSNIDTESK